MAKQETAARRGNMGYLPFHNYTPKDYGRKLQSQNWSVTQDDRGIIYVANPNGVLVYDAEQWRLIPTERQTLVRTVVTDTSGTVYVGAYGEIGKLEPDTTGTQRYVSLLDEIDPKLRDFGHTWNGAATSNGVFFQTHRTIFRWNGTSMQHWQATDSTRFSRVFSVHDSLYVHEQGAGLKKFKEGNLQLIPGSERFAEDAVYALLPYNNGLLVGTESGEMYRYVEGAFEPFEVEAAPFLAENELYDGVQLPNGTYALATLRGGVLIINRRGETLQVLDKRAGLVSNDVKSLFVDQQGGLWLACESGLARVEALSPLSLYDERTGLEGAGQALARHEGDLYAGTSSGVYHLSYVTNADGVIRPQFQLVSELRAQVFDLHSTSAGLLAATEKGVYAIQNDRPRRIGSGRTAVGLDVSRYDSTLAYVGYIDGVGTLHRSGDRWTEGSMLRGFNKEIYFLKEDVTGALWIASAFGGLWRIDVTNGLQDDPRIQQFASEEQTPRHVYRMAYLDGQGLRIVTRDGLAQPVTDETGQVTLRPDSTIYDLLPAGHAPLTNVEPAPDGDIWTLTESAVFWLDRRSDGSYVVSTPLARSPDLGVFFAYAERGGTFWLAGEEGILQHTPRRGQVPSPSIQTLIRRVATVETDSLIFGGNAPRSSAVEIGVRRGKSSLAYEHNALRFEFAAPGFGDENGIEYQHRLIGFSDEWSPWSNEAKKDYTNLPPGTYEFQVQARNPHVWKSSVASFNFEVFPPWYRTMWAYALFGALGVALVAGAVWWRSAHLEARARKLERMVAQRTEEVQDQAKQLASYNRELRQTNEVLQEALEQKSELLGIAAHDLKNPLFGIRGLSEILLENRDLDESMHRKIELIYESADETLELINDLLESAAASSGQVRLEMELIDMEPVAEWVVHSFRQQAEKKGQELHFEAPDADCRIEADERKLREAMSNLVSNAVKYSPKGSRIEVEVQRSGDEVSFIVQDEGPGLNEEERKNLFAPFQRLSPEPTAGEASSGLGLYIVKQLVELHDGHVWVESEVGEGSTFGITIPAAWADSKEKEEMPAAEARN